MRTFVAIELSQAVRQQLASHQRRLEQHLAEAGAANVIRWTTLENLHLTLRFLGETTAAQQTAILNAFPTLAAQHAPLQLMLHQLGCFPNFRRPNIVWIDLQGTVAELKELQRAIDAAVLAAGFLPEERPFTPHLTIGRARRDASPAAVQQAGTVLREQATTSVADHTASAFYVSQIVLMQSELKPAGPTYTPLGIYTLGR